MKQHSIPIEPRPVTGQEAAVIEWLLDNAAVRDVSAYRLKPLSSLQVTPCGCGKCAGFDFQPFSEEPLPFVMLADAIAYYQDHQQAGSFSGAGASRPSRG